MNNFSTQITCAPTGADAVVIGGSVAGLLTARALAVHFERVTILERKSSARISLS